MKLATLTGAITAAGLATMLSTVHAGGFLADTFLRPISPQLADAADDWNRRAGHPVEAAVSAAADSYAPGSGAVLQGAWALQRAQQNARGAGAPPPGAAPGFAPPTGYGGRPISRPVSMPPQYPAPHQPQYQPQYQPQGMVGVCRAGMYYVTNRGAGPIGAPCGPIMDPMGGMWPGFYAPN